MKIYLASRSARRRELLKQIDIDYELIDIEIDEHWDGKEKPEDYVCRISHEKAKVGKSKTSSDLPVLAADTCVVIDGTILGKAENSEDVKNMLLRLSGKTHYVLSAVTLVSKSTQTKINISEVTFKELSDNEIRTYADTEEPIGKAGGYAIQGKAAAFIERLEGSYSGVMGLPLYETQKLLEGTS